MSISTETRVRASPSTTAAPVTVLNPPSCLPAAPLVPTQVILVLSPVRATLVSAATAGIVRATAAAAAMNRRMRESPSEAGKRVVWSRRGLYGRPVRRASYPELPVGGRGLTRGDGN